MVSNSSVACLLSKLIRNHRDNWARQTSPNKDVKVYIGAPASTSGARSAVVTRVVADKLICFHLASGTGYQDIATLSKIAVQMRKSFPSFGGVMLWDASQADGMI